jgi:riboflavin synthase
MFTGIIESLGTLIERREDGDTAVFVVATELAPEMAVGDSLAVNGVCLTVEEINGASRQLTFHLLAQTLKVTALGTLQTGDRLNLERAMQLQDRLGGHLVSGHVDCVSSVVDIFQHDKDHILQIALPADLRANVIDKGSIAVDGISLTVAELLDDSFKVHIIPHTWAVTRLHALAAGSPVNLEMDMVGKYVLRSLTAEGVKG